MNRAPAKFQIRCFTLDKDKVIDISSEEATELIIAKDRLFGLLLIEEAFDILIQNFAELEKECLALSIDYMVSSNGGEYFFHDGRRLLNRRLMNILTTARSYLEHVRVATQRLLNARDAKRIVELMSKQYNTRFGYRVMEALRNYAQHRGLPIHGISFGAEWVAIKEVKRNAYTVEPTINCKALRDDSEFKKSVLNDLENEGESVDIKPLVRQYITGLAVVQDFIRDVTKEVADKDERVILEAIKKFHQRFSSQNGVDLVVLVRVLTDNRIDGETQLFSEFLEYRRHLTKMNCGFQTLDARFVMSLEREPKAGVGRL